MKILVCGGRDYTDKKRVFETLDRWNESNCIKLLIAGGASGADELAVKWAESRAVKHTVIKADWQKHGYAAGPIRNQRMLEEEKPDIVLVFPGGRGTADMVRRAKAAGVRTVEASREVG